MGFDTSYPNRKDWRQPFYYPRHFIVSERGCRPGRDCRWCLRDRQQQARREQARAVDALKDWRTRR